MSRGPPASYVGEFSGWTYPSARPLGFVKWNPRGDDEALTEAVLGVFSHYRAGVRTPVRMP